MSAIRRLSRLIISAATTVALGFALFGSTQQVQAADGNDVTTHRGGVYGRLRFNERETKTTLKKMFKSSAVPVGNNSSATPAVPARVSIYNMVGTWRGSARTWMRKPKSAVVTANYNVTVDAGDPLHFSFTEWNTSYRFVLYNEAGKKVRVYRIRTTRAWAKRHAWTTRQRDIVVSGTGGGGGGGNPPPVTTYPKGAKVTVNDRDGVVLNRIDYTASGATLGFAYPNITKGNWAYEVFTQWYGSSAVSLSQKTYFGDSKTKTITTTAPMSATAEAVVDTVSTVDN